MTRQYFGTDGIRGLANMAPMTAEIAQRVAMAAGIALKTHKTHARVVIGKDTRLSCYMLEQAMASGFLSMGMEVLFFGPMPTPGVAMLTRSMRADLGVMISASHNDYQDNGIKLFGSDGFKLSDEKELEIEKLLTQDLSKHYASPENIGRAKRIDDAQGRYVEYVKNTFPRDFNLEGLKVVIDCANGAGYKVAPEILWELGAEVTPIAVRPNGKNINLKCGTVHTERLQKTVVEEGADVGIALDGDADRLIMVDEKGNRIDGDQLMGLVALDMSENGALGNDTLVTTIMSNVGLERCLKTKGISLKRVGVGDRYVMEGMKETGSNFGGEQSGHMIFSDHSTTGDGLLSALHVLRILKSSGDKASNVFNVFTPVPQILKNLVYDRDKGSPLEQDKIKNLLKETESSLNNEGGRLVVRLSGTEPKIRVMAEGDDPKKVEEAVDTLLSEIEKCA